LFKIRNEELLNNLSIYGLLLYLFNVKTLQDYPLSDIQRQDLNDRRFLAFHLNNSLSPICIPSTDEHILASSQVNLEGLVGTVEVFEGEEAGVELVERPNFEVVLV
jgi:hypothetical protein